MSAGAADRLWEHQLRKENRAILDQLKELEKQRRNADDEILRKVQESEERLDAMEARLSEVDAELKKYSKSAAEAKMVRSVTIEDIQNLMSDEERRTGGVTVYKVPTTMNRMLTVCRQAQSNGDQPNLEHTS
jgi:DNA repair ATPase RecN